jgi:hypothetical protein
MHTIFDILKAPLHTRGWTFQELVLSCRTLNFCEDQLLWHCLERTATEDGMVDIPGYSKDYQNADVVLSKLGIKIGHLGKINDIDFLRIYWWNIVEQFTSRSLTEITDRLPALSGIITELQERTEDTTC